MEFDLSQTDALLSTTRAVRKRLDLSKPVPRALIDECLELAVQAPTGGNAQGWSWLVVDDPDKRKALSDLYRVGAEGYLASASKQADESGDKQSQRVFSSAIYLMEHLHEVPVHLIPCIQGRPKGPVPAAAMSGLFGSIYPAIWSFQLAARSRGLGTALTTLHLAAEQQAQELLGLPEDIQQVALLPVAFTVGTDFKAAQRPPVAEITHWNAW
jgi:nitroreductase